MIRCRDEGVLTKTKGEEEPPTFRIPFPPFGFPIDLTTYVYTHLHYERIIPGIIPYGQALSSSWDGVYFPALTDLDQRLVSAEVSCACRP